MGLHRFPKGGAVQIGRLPSLRFGQSPEERPAGSRSPSTVPWSATLSFFSPENCRWQVPMVARFFLRTSCGPISRTLTIDDHSVRTSKLGLRIWFRKEWRFKSSSSHRIWLRRDDLPGHLAREVFALSRTPSRCPAKIVQRRNMVESTRDWRTRIPKGPRLVSVWFRFGRRMANIRTATSIAISSPNVGG